MDQLLKQLEVIKELMKQISGITNNQATVLLQQMTDEESEDDFVGLIEEMADCKELLMNELEEVEEQFNTSYENYRVHLTDKQEIELLKSHVAEVLRLKQEILDGEKNNFMLMQCKANARKKVEVIQKSPSQIVDAYKKQIKS